MRFLFPVMAAFLFFSLMIMSGCTQQPAAPVSTSTSVATATSTDVSIIPVCPPVAPKGCPEKGVYQAVDVSEAVTPKLLDAVKCAGVHTIIRYYDWPGHESLAGKIPTDAEFKLIKQYGFNVLFVFQHYNQNFSTFTDPTRPEKDIAAIMALAKKFGQPKGSGIYIGVDGDFYTKDQMAAVKKYFGAISPALQKAGFKVGMYGGGANCLSLRTNGSTDLPCWIAASSWGWSMTKQVLAANDYGMKQKVNQMCAGVSLDYNTINPKYTDVGQWKP